MLLICPLFIINLPWISIVSPDFIQLCILICPYYFPKKHSLTLNLWCYELLSCLYFGVKEHSTLIIFRYTKFFKAQFFWCKASYWQYLWWLIWNKCKSGNAILPELWLLSHQICMPVSGIFKYFDCRTFLVLNDTLEGFIDLLWQNYYYYF